MAMTVENGRRRRWSRSPSRSRSRSRSPGGASRRGRRRPSPTYDDDRARGEGFRERERERERERGWRENNRGWGRQGYRGRERGRESYGGGRGGFASGSGSNSGSHSILRDESHRYISKDEDMELRSKAVGDEREYRRLKRLELAKRVKVNLWASSPSPPPSSELLAASGEAYAQANANGKGKRVEEEENKKEREEKEAAKGIEAQEKEQAVKLKEEEKEEESSSESGSDEEEVQEELKRFKAFLDKLQKERELKLAEQARLEEESRLVGPEMPSEAKHAAPGTYGKNLLPGEGDAMAAYVQSGQRIPRRGEIGLSSDQIASYEDLGYIMSGSRHSRMNAIRIRKENQVYSAEEKAALSMINFEEKKAKEQQVMRSMQALVKQHLQSEDVNE